MDLHALQSGYMLSEYRIEKLLGEGGFGLTYLAIDTNLDKKVAIKEYMPSEHSIRKDDSQIVSRSTSSNKVYKWGLNAFLNEAKILAKFEDSNIVRIYRFFEANGTAYIVMEYCEGGCLVDLISKNEHMPEQQLKEIVTSIVHGLQLVHNDGILHRDIKPDNIMFRENGTPVLIDFGAARQAIGNKSRKVTTIITPGYAPLEQYSSKGDIGPWSDIYSLSAVAYLCLTGEKPPDIMNRLHEDTIKKLADSKTSSPFLKSLDHALSLHVNDRPKSLSEWSKDWKDFSLVNKDSTNDNFKDKFKPIYAEKQSQQNNFRIPISARSSIEPDELTRVDYNVRQISKNKSTSTLRVLSLIALTFFFVGGGYFGYDYYQKHQGELPFFSQKTDTNKLKANQQHDLILKVQQQLNLLNYLVPENGTIDTRTMNSIKSFEKKKQLVVTGEADEILLDLLIRENRILDDKAWNQAQEKNTKSAYENYLKLYPKGEYAAQVPQTIINLKLKQLKDIEAQEIKDQQQNQQESKRLEQIASIKTQLVKDIQNELKRLKFTDLNTDGNLSNTSINAIKSYQKITDTDINGLPSKTLLFQLKSEKKWPGRLIGETFNDCRQCPTMVVIPAGEYMMGSSDGKSNEQPLHHVNIKEFAISQTEVTFQQWDICYADGGCTYQPTDDGLGRADQAVMHINYYDAQQYINWINQQTQKTYRLPSESEWEYAARAGSSSAYSWGEYIGINHVYCQTCDSGLNFNQSQINRVKNFPANDFGLYDMHGNLWEWTQDCWHASYSGAPTDNQAWEPIGCNSYVTRGGSAGSSPEDLRSANRGNMNADKRLNSLGFRIAVDIK